jgi:hypothetical protein
MWKSFFPTYPHYGGDVHGNVTDPVAARRTGSAKTRKGEKPMDKVLNYLETSDGQGVRRM